MIKNSKLFFKPSSLSTQKSLCSLKNNSQNTFKLADSFNKLTQTTFAQKLDCDSKNINSELDDQKSVFGELNTNENLVIKDMEPNVTSNFIFGQNLHDRVENIHEDVDTSVILDIGSSSNDILQSAENYSKQMQESKKVTGLMEGPEFTGEEYEKTVLRSFGKLYEFTSIDKSWIERGSGYLKLNDSNTSTENLRSRLIMRNLGNLRLILNTFVFLKTNPENPTKNSLRFMGISIFGDCEKEEAVNQTKISTFLFKSTNSSDIENITSAIKSRINDLEKYESSEVSERLPIDKGADDDNQNNAPDKSHKRKLSDADRDDDTDKAQSSDKSSEAVVGEDKDHGLSDKDQPTNKKLIV